MQENFASLLEFNARRFGAKTALVWDQGELTWSELERRASGFAALLAGEGIGAGDRIAVSIPNRWDFVVAFFGLLKLGATPALVNPLLEKDEIAALLANLKPKQLVKEVGPARRAEGGDWRTPSLVSAPALVLYTSGSTGRPKGAFFSHRALAFTSRSWGAIMALRAEDVVLAVLPASHSLGLKASVLAPLVSGATVALVERFTPEEVFKAIERHRVTVFPGVPTIFRRLLNSAAFSGADLSSLRLAVTGAAPCPLELYREWQGRTGKRLLRGYGATEIPRAVSYLADDPTEIADAVGRAVPGVELRLMDDDGRVLPWGEVGELWIKTPAAMEGYLDDPEETRAVLVDGWFKTGDLATVSPEGFVRLVGRKRERILRGGYSVFPQDVEAALLSHPAVAEAAVVGVPDPDMGEEVAAFVTLKPGAKTDAEALMAYTKEHLARYKYPRRLVILKEMPKGKTGKIQKSELTKRTLP